MSEIQEIDVFIQPDGTVKLQVRGAKGPQCLDLTRGLEELLGGRITERVHTEEFDEATQEQEERLHQRAG